MADYSILGFVTKLTEMTIASDKESGEALRAAAEIVQTEAKKEIGNYQGQAGQFAGWAELADSTKEDRLRQGFTENDPLLRTGDMRDSIEITVEGIFGGAVAYIGSNSQIAEWQELGTSKMPARSFLGGALYRKADEVVEILGDRVAGALVGHEVHQGKIPII